MGAELKKYIWLLSVFATLLISYFLAKMTTLFIEGQFPNVVITSARSQEEASLLTKQKTKDIDIDVIFKRNFFDSQETEINSDMTFQLDSTGTEDSQETIGNDVPVLTSLDIKLISTLSLGDGKNPQSSCVISSGREVDAYTILSQESFAPNTKIIQILPKKVIFTNQKKLEYVLLEDFAKTVDLNRPPDKTPTTIAKHVTKAAEGGEEIVREGDVFQIKRSAVEKALAEVEKLYTDIRAVPFFKEGKANGFKLLSVKRGSFFDKLGLRRGDILKTVNGTVLDIQSGLQTFNKLKNEANFELELERRDTSQTFKYEIVD